MLYLIDGYNLLFAMGVLKHRMGPQGLERARLSLLGLLKGSYGDEADAVTVVFDAARAPAGAPAEVNFQGIQVRFAVDQDQADDLIEILIRKASAPKHLTVVSDDHRIRNAGKRRSCPVMGCGDFLDWLKQRRRPMKTTSEPGKPAGASGEETGYWLAEFASLADDADLKELFNPHGFLDEEDR